MTEGDGAALTRRGFAVGCASILALGLAGGPAGSADRLARFRSLSARLTGFPEEAVDRELALGLMEGLAAAGDRAGLDRLLSGTGGDAEGELARRIAVAWYSGIHPAAGGPAVRTFHDALVWRALDFTKPPGVCSAAPGDWSVPPARAETRP